MQLGELLGLPVRDADDHAVGNLIDVRLSVAEDRDDSAPEVFGFVISPHTHSSYLGYERTRVNAPLPLAAMLRWRHRGTFLALWSDVARVDGDRITLQPGYRRYSPALPTD